MRPNSLLLLMFERHVCEMYDFLRCVGRGLDSPAPGRSVGRWRSGPVHLRLAQSVRCRLLLWRTTRMTMCGTRACHSSWRPGCPPRPSPVVHIQSKSGSFMGERRAGPDIPLDPISYPKISILNKYIKNRGNRGLRTAVNFRGLRTAGRHKAAPGQQMAT